MSERLHHARITAPWMDDVVNERVYAGAGTKASVAGEFSMIQLVNPAGSGVWIYVPLIVLGDSNANTKARIGLNVAIQESKVNDVRSLSDSNSLGQGDIFASSSASQLVLDAQTLFQVGMLSNGNQPHFRLEQFPFILKPGDVLSLETAESSRDITGSFLVIERPISN